MKETKKKWQRPQFFEGSQCLYCFKFLTQKDFLKWCKKGKCYHELMAITFIKN